MDNKTKQLIIEFLPHFEESYQLDLNRYQDPKKENSAHGAYPLILGMRGLAVENYWAKGDIIGLREKFSEVGRLAAEMFERHDAGWKIDSSYLTLSEGKLIFFPLAVGDFKMAEHFAKVLVGRETKTNYSIQSQAMRDLILGKKDQAREYILSIEDQFDKRLKSLKGYAVMTRAIAEGDTELFNEWLAHAIKYYKKACTTDRFSYSCFEYLAIWALGLINLAIHNGMPPTIPDSDYLPKELIVGLKE